MAIDKELSLNSEALSELFASPTPIIPATAPELVVVPETPVPTGLQGLSSPFHSDLPSLPLFTPTLSIARKPRAAARKPLPQQNRGKKGDLGPSIPYKRQRLDIEPETFDFRATSSNNSIFGSIGANIPGSTSIGGIDLKKIVQEAISPLINEIRELKGEIQLLKAKKANSTDIAPQRTEENKKQGKIPQKEPKTAVAKAIASKKQDPAQIPAKKQTYASILANDAVYTAIQTSKPWTIVQKKTKPKAQDLAPKKATEPCQRRLVFLRAKNAPQAANLADMLLALNRAIRRWELPEHISLLKIGYTGSGAISCLLNDRATAQMIIPSYSDALIKVAIQFDSKITGVEQAEQWYRLRVHGVLLSRYFENPEGLKLAKEEIEVTGLSIPLTPYWLVNKEKIREKYNSKLIKCSTIIVTVRSKLEADKLTTKGLYFGGYNHTVDRYWETGPEKICPKCLEYGHTSYRACTAPAKCYICAGSHEASEHKCLISSCTAVQGKSCIHWPIKCVHCKGPHIAISSSCPKRKAAIEVAKAKKQAAKDLAASRERIQVVIPVKKQAIQPSQAEQAIQPSQMELDSETELSKQAANQLLC